MKRTSVVMKIIKNRKFAALLIAATVIVCVTGITLAVLSGKRESVAYREVTVTRGNLTVGLTESGSVDIGTVTQSFDLDMSALLRVSTTNTGSSSDSSSSAGFSGMSGTVSDGFDIGSVAGPSGGGMSFSGGNSFSQIFRMASGDTQSSSQNSSKLVISESLVSVGQTVSVGDVIYRLESEGVEELTEEIKSNVDKAKADLDALLADQEISKLSALYNYDLTVAYYDYASVEKANSIGTLQESLNTYKESLESAKELVTLYTERLNQAKKDLEVATGYYNGALYNKNSYSKTDDTNMYSYYAVEVENIKKTMETLENSVSSYETKLEQAKKNVSDYTTQISKAERQLELGKISAEETYELRLLAYENAQETYDIALAYLEDDLNEQQKIYDEASEKWETFVSYIDGEDIKSNYNGIITSVDLEPGDSLTTGATVVTLYDTDDVSMTVTIDEDDMSSISIGAEANVTLIAYPEDVFKAVVSEISDATTDSLGNTTQDVTVTFTSDVSGLYHGMTGEITFLTKEVSDVCYVSNRAITRKGTRSCVKVKDKSGNITTVYVKTGFSDGVNVEITEGLSEGDVVLVESKVSK